MTVRLATGLSSIMPANTNPNNVISLHAATIDWNSSDAWVVFEYEIPAIFTAPCS